MSPLLRNARHLLISAGPGPEGDPVLAAIGPEIAEIAPIVAASDDQAAKALLHDGAAELAKGVQSLGWHPGLPL